jgi:pimeloyl-ACP methyl ester carboxylesterase
MTRRILAVLGLFVGLYLAPATAMAQETGLKQPSFDSDGVAIHYVVAGPEDGEAVVLIHGFAGSIDPLWTQVMAALKKDFKVIAMDCRGHGGSGKPHDPAKYGFEMGNDVARLLDHLKIERAHVVGYSMGCYIAQSFAVHHPQRVRTVTLGGGGGINRGREKLMLAVADSLEKGEGLGPLIAELTPKDRPPPTPETLKMIDKVVLSTNDALALAATARGAARDRLSDKQVEGVMAPTLAIIGADDPVRDDVDALKKLRPGIRVVVIDKSDHMTAWTRPEFIAALREFLDDNRRQAKQ